MGQYTYALLNHIWCCMGQHQRVCCVHCQQELLHLTKHQQKLAKSIWREMRADLDAAMEDRQRILLELRASRAAASLQRGMEPDRVSETNAVLQLALALAENSAIQHEITMQSQRRFMLQVGPPDWLLHVDLSTDHGHEYKAPTSGVGLCPVCRSKIMDRPATGT